MRLNDPAYCLTAFAYLHLPGYREQFKFPFSIGNKFIKTRIEKHFSTGAALMQNRGFAAHLPDLYGRMTPSSLPATKTGKNLKFKQ